MPFVICRITGTDERIVQGTTYVYGSKSWQVLIAALWLAYGRRLFRSLLIRNNYWRQSERRPLQDARSNIPGVSSGRSILSDRKQQSLLFAPYSAGLQFFVPKKRAKCTRCDRPYAHLKGWDRRRFFPFSFMLPCGDFLYLICRVRGNVTNERERSGRVN